MFEDNIVQGYNLHTKSYTYLVKYLSSLTLDLGDLNAGPAVADYKVELHNFRRQRNSIKTVNLIAYLTVSFFRNNDKSCQHLAT